MKDDIDWDIRAIYLSLWEVDDGSRTFMVLRESGNIDYGNIVVAPGVNANSLLETGISNGSYPTGSFLVEVVEDFDDFADGVDLN